MAVISSHVSSLFSLSVTHIGVATSQNRKSDQTTVHCISSLFSSRVCCVSNIFVIYYGGEKIKLMSKEPASDLKDSSHCFVSNFSTGHPNFLMVL